MENKNNDEEKHLEILERYFGFLGVIVALVMTITWDFINGSKFETISDNMRIQILFCYAVCLILLGLICLFYILLLKGIIKGAKRLGNLLMGLFLVVLILGAVPVSPFIPSEIFGFLQLILVLILYLSLAIILVSLDIDPLVDRSLLIIADSLNDYAKSLKNKSLQKILRDLRNFIIDLRRRHQFSKEA